MRDCVCAARWEKEEEEKEQEGDGGLKRLDDALKQRKVTTNKGVAQRSLA